MGQDRPSCIVVTGASRGLGRAMVDGFIAQGRTVFGCARSREAVDQLSKQYAAPNAFEQVDVRDDNAVQAWAERVLADHDVAILVNSAALMNRPAPLWDIDADEFDAVIDTNLKGVANVIRHFAPTMVDRGEGLIVNFSSLWGRSVSSEVAPYCCTKWGVEGLTKALAAELPRSMAAVALNPGIIDTDMLRTCFGDAASHYGGPEEWAERAVPFILGLGPNDNGVSASVPG